MANNTEATIRAFYGLTPEDDLSRMMLVPIEPPREEGTAGLAEQFAEIMNLTGFAANEKGIDYAQFCMSNERAILAALHRPSPGVDDTLLLTIIARSIGRTIHTENFHARAQDVLDSIRSENLSPPQPSRIPPSPDAEALRQAREALEAAASHIQGETDHGLSTVKARAIALTAKIYAALAALRGKP